MRLWDGVSWVPGRVGFLVLQLTIRAQEPFAETLLFLQPGLAPHKQQRWVDFRLTSLPILLGLERKGYSGGPKTASISWNKPEDILSPIPTILSSIALPWVIPVPRKRKMGLNTEASFYVCLSIYPQSKWMDGGNDLYIITEETESGC